MTTCPECGGAIQATSDRATYLSFDLSNPQEPKITESWSPGNEIRFYCENDHTLNDRLEPELYEKLLELVGQQER